MANTIFIISMWEMLENENSSFYIETLKQLKSNVIDKSKDWKVVADKYNALIPYLNIRLDRLSSDILFNKYIVPIAYHAASNDRNYAASLYHDMINFMINYVSERTENKIFTLKREVA